ncbi:MFS transporter [Microtetraspora fusca]|uniref:MFS transporter n=1 Tax=Microtetraspora fusca TaxID=1997 RepID=A0ABW6V9N5_MICFU
MIHATRFRRPSPRSDRLPLAGLLALATGGFITIMTEALPAGILPAMSADLGVSESAAGQSVMVYAVGSMLAAVPLTAATVGWPRKRLLLVAISGFALANTITAVSTDYTLTMTARFLAGVVAGLLWALVAGYARRMVPAHRRGKATAVAMAGTPVALSIGVPAGTSLAGLVGWRFTFGIMTLLSLILIAWVILTVPGFPGTSRAARLPLRRVLAIPGVAQVLTVTLTFVLAHNVLYTYIAPFLGQVGLADRVDVVLLAFGVASLVSILITGALIDRHLRRLMIVGCALFATATLLLGLLAGVPALVYAGAAIWGLGFGGAATILQTASAEAAGAAGEVAQSLIVTCWNIGIAGGAAAGGVLLGVAGSGSLPWWTFVLVAMALLMTVMSRRHGFPNLVRRLARE